MTRLRCVLVWKAHSKCGTQTESVRRARSKISRSNWGLHCYRQYDRGDTWVLVGVQNGKKKERDARRVSSRQNAFRSTCGHTRARGNCNGRRQPGDTM